MTHRRQKLQQLLVKIGENRPSGVRLKDLKLRSMAAKQKARRAQALPKRFLKIGGTSRVHLSSECLRFQGLKALNQVSASPESFDTPTLSLSFLEETYLKETHSQSFLQSESRFNECFKGSFTFSPALRGEFRRAYVNRGTRPFLRILVKECKNEREGQS